MSYRSTKSFAVGGMPRDVITIPGVTKLVDWQRTNDRTVFMGDKIPEGQTIRVTGFKVGAMAVRQRDGIDVV